MKRIILASEGAECGLAALAMVANALGYHCTLLEMRQRFPLSLKGATIADLISIAQKLGLQSRALRLELEDIGKLRLPCILHWNLNHFVVLDKVSARRVEILDPALGRRRMRHDELSRHFTGIALELSSGTDFQAKKATPSITLRQLLGRVQGLKRSLGLLIALSLSLQIFVLIAPFFLQWTIDQVLVSADTNLMTVLALGFGLAMLIQHAVGLLRGWVVITLSNQLGIQWAGNVFTHLLRLPMEFFEKRHLGDIISRVGSLGAIQKTLTTSFVEAFIDGLMATATAALMVIYSWRLALVTFIAVGLYLLLRLATYHAFRDKTEQQLNAGAKQQTYLLESLRGIGSLRIAGAGAHRSASYSNLMVDTANQDVVLARMGLAYAAACGLIFGAERIAVVWIGALLAMSNVFSVGMLIAYLAYKDQFTGRISGLIDRLIQFRMLRLHGERLADIVLCEPESDGGSTIQQSPRGFSLKTAGLTFRYGEGEAWVVRGIDLEIEEGECVAIVGPSGCGKTTLLKLLLGLLKPSEGRIEVGNMQLAQLGLENYRRHIGVVMQEDQLFAGSLIENIALGDEFFSLADIEAAARLAEVHEDICRMPMGYHTLIGDMGTALSGGQKQRILLARALYRRPKILFLDEATSHLDVERERLVNEAIKHLKITRLIIAHRPETIASADRVLMMQDGRIVQQPTSLPVMATSCRGASELPL